MAAVTTPHLPPEVVSCIIASVPSKSTLCNIALCSSFFYSLTVPILYADVHVYSHNHSFKTLRPLTTLLLTKPTFAQHVRQFTLRDMYSDDYDQTKSSENRTWKVEGVLREAVFANSHSGKDFEEWMMRISGDHPDALLAILLPTMVRLEKLGLMLRSDYPYFDRMLTRAIGKEKPFDSQLLFPVLKEFMHQPSLEWYTNRRFRDWRHQSIGSKYIILFQSFPEIRSIYGYGISETNENLLRISGRYPVASCVGSSLTHLELQWSFITTQNLCAILKIPKALQTFIYEICMESRHTLPESDNTPEDVFIALAPQYNSLENLWLVASDEMNLEFHHMMSSLSEFVGLKSLRVAAHVLLTLLQPDEDWTPLRRNLSDFFPATLETLHIIYDASGSLLWNLVSGFVLAEINQVPKLRNMFIQVDNGAEAPVDWKEVQEKAKSHGVDLISLNSNWVEPSTFECERGWGMDGSIKWAPCAGNQCTMPVVRDWKDNLKATSRRAYEEEAKYFFYKWHLCHEGKFYDEL
jgi:hypothetical protein